MSGALVGFYVVSALSSNYGAHHYYRILSVRADGNDSVVRYLRIAPVDVSCIRMIVQSAETRISGKSPVELVGSSNPCTFGQRSINHALGKSKIRRRESMSYGIVAQCGSTERSLSLPNASKEDLERIERSNPAEAELWGLMNKIVLPAFGEKDLFTDRSEQDDLALQHAAQPRIEQLRGTRILLVLRRRGELRTIGVAESGG